MRTGNIVRSTEAAYRNTRLRGGPRRGPGHFGVIDLGEYAAGAVGASRFLPAARAALAGGIVRGMGAARRPRRRADSMGGTHGHGRLVP